MIDGVLYADESYQIIGAAMAVHRFLGKGFVEGVYGDCLELEFKKRQIPYEREKEMHILYHDVMINHTYRPDFVCYGKIIVELKAVSGVTPDYEAQTINYLRVSGMSLGLLINFGEQELWQKRYLNIR